MREARPLKGPSPTGTRRARLQRRLVTSALGVTKDAETVLRWLAQQVIDAPTPKERRLCAEAFLKHMREVAKGDPEAAAQAGARVLVIAPDELRRVLGAPDASEALARQVEALIDGRATKPADALGGPQ